MRPGQPIASSASRLQGRPPWLRVATEPGFEGTLTAFGDPDGILEVAVVEHLRVRVRADARAAWLQAETHTWEPWLRRQRGFLGRELIWDAEREEGILLIRWASREEWKSIPPEEVDAVQRQFEAMARRLLAPQAPTPVNPFPLVHAGELEPRAFAAAA
ncbi:MAG: TIGR03792 family protein [Cyanobium sp.]